MKSSHWLLSIGLLSIGLLCAAVPALSRAGSPVPDQAPAGPAQFVDDRIDDGRLLLFGPDAPRVAPVPAGQTCAELYERRLQLMRSQYDYKPAYTDDPRNRAAVFIGTITTAGFYYLPFSGVQAYLDANDDGDVQAEIDALRYASAAQQCFVN